MFKELKFVQGAVAKKDFVPAITHFCIENGTVRAYNGTIALCSPIPCDINCIPKAGPMVQAISRCSDTIMLSMTPAGRLSIRSGKFKAFVDCVEETQSHVQPEGEIVHFDGEVLLQAIKTIHPFIGNDASRQFTNGILLRGQSAFATNNVCLVEYWLGVEMPFVVNIPRAAIAEMVRLDEAPTHAQVDHNSMTFHYSGGRWIRTQLFSTDWPDLGAILGGHETRPRPVPEGFFDALDDLKPFRDKFGRVYLSDGALHTHADTSEGAQIDFPQATWEQEAIFNLEMLELLDGVAQTIDFNLEKSGAGFMMFFGERLRGCVIGMRLPDQIQ